MRNTFCCFRQSHWRAVNFLVVSLNTFRSRMLLARIRSCYMHEYACNTISRNMFPLVTASWSIISPSSPCYYSRFPTYLANMQWNSEQHINIRKTYLCVRPTNAAIILLNHSFDNTKETKLCLNLSIYSLSQSCFCMFVTYVGLKKIWLQLAVK